MRNGYDCITNVIEVGDDKSLYIPIAKIPRYQGDNNYTQYQKYILKIVDLSTYYAETNISIATSNVNGNIIVAKYLIDAPKLKIVISSGDSKYWWIYVKPNGAYGHSIGVKIVAAENPASIILLNGYKPIVDIATVTNRVEIGYDMSVIRHNVITMPTMDDVKALVTSTDVKGYNYEVGYNTLSGADKTITPNQVAAVWLIKYTENGISSLNLYAKQEWERISESSYEKYIRVKTTASSWGAFIKVN